MRVRVIVLTSPTREASETTEFAQPVRPRFRRWSELRRRPAFWLGFVGVLAFVLMAVAAPVISPYDPAFAHRDGGLSLEGDPVRPSDRFALGTDRLGRDYLSRLLHGARASLIVGIGATAIATIIGVIVGAAAAFAGSRSVRVPLGRGRSLVVSIPVESLLMRTTDVILAFPVLLVAIALTAIVRPSLILIVGIIAGFLWTSTARVVYGRVLVVQRSDFVESARAIGASDSRILIRHILPHVWSIVVVYAALGISGAILFEATLSYLGVGIPPPAPSWGTMIAEHISYYATDPRLVLLPGMAIMLTILFFNLLGDALRDALDPFAS